MDKGAKALALCPGDKVTEGLDGLRDRLDEYRHLGAQFAKWRAVIEIDVRDIPSAYGFAPMLTRWRVMPRCARKPAWCRSWNRKC